MTDPALTSTPLSPQDATISPPLLAQASAALERGKAVGFPTETVWGLGAAANNETAVSALSRLKGRPLGKALQVSCLSAEQALTLLQPEQPLVTRLLPLLPGPLTLVGWASVHCPPWLQFAGKVGVRVPAHPVIQQLLAHYGQPLATTSLNPARQPSALSYAQAQAYALAAVLLPDVQLPSEAQIEQRLHSTVVDCTTGQILRAGLISEDVLRPLLEQP